jgi:hypothetical protein
MDWYGIAKDFAAPTVALIGIIVTGWLAFAGLKTFGRWKRERLEEKRIDVAIEALAIAFEARLVFDDIRARFTRTYVYADTKTDGVPDGKNRQRTLQDSCAAVLKRVEAHQPFFDKALALEPKFVAVFGRDKDAVFERLFSARKRVIDTVEALLDDSRVELDPDDSEGRGRRVKWRKQIFASPGIVDEEDEVGKSLQQFRDEIEKLCRPIVDRTFNPKEPASKEGSA